MIEGFTVRKLNEDLINDLIFLYKICFKKEVQKSEIKNKHIYCDGTSKYVGFIAYDNTSFEPAAYYGVFPNYMKYENKLILVAQSGDTMTNPNFRKRGLFIKLAEITYNYCVENKIYLITGLPNKYSIGGFLKHLNFKHIGNLETLILFENKLHYNRIIYRSKKLSHGINQFSNNILRKIFGETNIFENSNLDSDNAFMVHNSNYQKLKIKENDYSIMITKNNIWIRIEANRVIICDIKINDRTKLKKDMFYLKTLTFILGKRFLSHTSSRNAIQFKEILRFSKYKSKNYDLIIRNLGLDIDIKKICFLECDADVF